ncbi:hypothetical protein GCM10009605_59100 [Nocardiopsis composta]
MTRPPRSRRAAVRIGPHRFTVDHQVVAGRRPLERGPVVLRQNTRQVPFGRRKAGGVRLLGGLSMLFDAGLARHALGTAEAGAPACPERGRPAGG